MEFEIFIKNKNKYEKHLVIPPSGSGQVFFKQLLLQTDQEIKNIRNDIKLVSNDQNINLKKPISEDSNIQQKLNSLVKIRKTNLNLKEALSDVLHDIEFIICPHCGSKMYKTPINVSYTRYGNSYIIEQSNTSVQYNYTCSNCVLAISAELYEREQYWIAKQKRLIEAGKDWVPNRFGFWVYI